MFGTESAPSFVTIYNNALSIDKITFNGSENNNLLFVGNDKKQVKVGLRGKVAVDMNMTIEIMLHSSDEVLVASYSPTQWDGTTYKIKAGEFEIEENVCLPKMLTSGEYYLSIRLSQVNIEHLAVIDRAANITVEQFASPITNDIFFQSYSGGIIMHGDE